jgi:transcriptional regulatory protein RtcR
VLFLDEIAELGLDEQAMLLRAIEERTFLPMGSDREVSSDFRLIAGTNRDLFRRVTQGRFREDLLARINLWTFELPALSERCEDIEPNLRYELDRASEKLQLNVTFNAEARRRFLEFAISAEAVWLGNFRDFTAAVTRMATLAPGGRIDGATVVDEVERLRRTWASASVGGAEEGARTALEQLIGVESADAIDRFDAVQLAEVIRVCRKSPTLSAAGRLLFDQSRKRRKSTNDADRLRKYLARFGLDFVRIQEG